DISAVYAGSTAYAGSPSVALSQSVSAASTTTALTSSLNPAGTGQAVTFTAKVSAVAPGAGVPAGTVQFVIDNVNFGSPVSLVSGSASSAAITTLTAGSHSVQAVYS